MRSECGEQRIGVKTHTAAREEVILTAREIIGRKSMAFDVAGRTDPVTASQGGATSSWIRGNATHDSEGLRDVERLAQGANESLVESMPVSVA